MAPQAVFSLSMHICDTGQRNLNHIQGGYSPFWRQKFKDPCKLSPNLFQCSYWALVDAVITKMYLSFTAEDEVILSGHGLFHVLYATIMQHWKYAPTLMPVSRATTDVPSTTTWQPRFQKLSCKHFQGHFQQNSQNLKGWEKMKNKFKAEWPPWILLLLSTWNRQHLL